jgi:hypothetical protein
LVRLISPYSPTEVVNRELITGIKLEKPSVRRIFARASDAQEKKDQKKSKNQNIRIQDLDAKTSQIDAARSRF